MYKTKASDFGYNRIFYIIEYRHWIKIFVCFERILVDLKITRNKRKFFYWEIF